MENTVSKLTVFFEEPFWVGVYERWEEGGYRVCKITFGAEPRDYEVYEFLQTHWRQLKFSSPTKTQELSQRPMNPKRVQRDITKLLQRKGVGTKAQQALKLQQEEGKAARRVLSRQEREAQKDRQFYLRQEKQKQKHRGH